MRNIYPCFETMFCDFLWLFPPVRMVSGLVQAGVCKRKQNMNLRNVGARHFSLSWIHLHIQRWIVLLLLTVCLCVNGWFWLKTFVIDCHDSTQLCVILTQRMQGSMWPNQVMHCTVCSQQKWNASIPMFYGQSKRSKLNVIGTTVRETLLLKKWKIFLHHSVFWFSFAMLFWNISYFVFYSLQ